MDILAVASFLASIGALLVAAVVAVVVGRRRGIDQVDEKADDATARTLAVQDRRIALQDREIAELKARVASLTAQVETLTKDLHASDAEVRRLSVRLSAAGGT